MKNKVIKIYYFQHTLFQYVLISFLQLFCFQNKKYICLLQQIKYLYSSAVALLELHSNKVNTKYKLCIHFVYINFNRIIIRIVSLCFSINLICKI